MTLLLDTEARIWWDADDRRLGGMARLLIQQASGVYVSAASAWKIVMKMALGKLRTTRRPAQVVSDAAFTELPITFEHTESVSALPPHHSDPFDRLIVAVATVEGLTIVSSDPQLAGMASLSSTHASSAFEYLIYGRCLATSISARNV